jgi:hypothetical protein
MKELLIIWLFLAFDEALLTVNRCIDRRMKTMGSTGVIVGIVEAYGMAAWWPIRLTWWAWASLARRCWPGSGGERHALQAEKDAYNLKLVTSWQPPDMDRLTREAIASVAKEQAAERNKRMVAELQALYRDYYGPGVWTPTEELRKQMRRDPRYESIVQKYNPWG